MKNKNYDVSTVLNKTNEIQGEMIFVFWHKKNVIKKCTRANTKIVRVNK